MYVAAILCYTISIREFVVLYIASCFLYRISFFCGVDFAEDNGIELEGLASRCLCCCHRLTAQVSLATRCSFGANPSLH